MDLSGSMQGAGGVGGLLSVNDGSATYYPTFDGNGNVSEYVDATGAVVAHYAYDALGQVVASGSKKDGFTHQFSTKQLDTESGLNYYGYRYSDSSNGRWLGRAPIEEKGGVNIYGFLHNSPMNFVDFLGLPSGKREVCKISMLVGHSANTDVSTVKRKLKESNLHDSDKIVCVTCFRVNTNNGINSVYSTVPDHRGTRVNGSIFPTDNNGMRNHDSFDKKRKDQTVCQAFAGELQNSGAEAKNMCNCCKENEIYARSIDEDGAAWLASNVFRNRAGSAPIATVTCGTGVPNATQHAGSRSCR